MQPTFQISASYDQGIQYYLGGTICIRLNVFRVLHVPHNCGAKVAVNRCAPLFRRIQVSEDIDPAVVQVEWTSDPIAMVLSMRHCRPTQPSFISQKILARANRGSWRIRRRGVADGSGNSTKISCNPYSTPQSSIACLDHRCNIYSE